MNISSRNSSSGATSTNGEDSQFANVKKQSLIYFYLLAIIAAMIMNSIVLLATYVDSRLHNANKYFVACLAVSDIFVAMFSVSIRLHQYIRPDAPLTIHSCRFWIWVDIFTETASITTLTIISIDRYLKVAKPFKYKIMMSTGKSRAIIVFLWIYSATVASLGLVPYNDYNGVHLTAKHKCVNDNKDFYTLAAILGFFLPLVILILMCALMFRIVKRFHQRRSTRHDDSSLSSAAFPRVHSARIIKGSNSSHRTVAIFGLVVLAFILCWGPFFVFFLIYQYNSKLISSNGKGQQILTLICFHMLPYANSFLNPVIYAYFDKSFNVAIRDLLLRIRGRPRSNLTSTSYALVHLINNTS